MKTFSNKRRKLENQEDFFLPTEIVDKILQIAVKTSSDYFHVSLVHSDFYQCLIRYRGRIQATLGWQMCIQKDLVEGIMWILQNENVNLLIVNHVLKWASSFGAVEVIDALVAIGVDINQKIYRNHHSLDTAETALINATRCGKLNTVKKLIELDADIHSRDKCGMTPLMIASMENHTEIIRTLIDKETSFEGKNNFGRTVLSFAVSYTESVEIIELLMKKGADITTRTKYGSTLLHYVNDRKVTKGYVNDVKIAKLLIGKGLDVNAIGREGMTPLMLAACCGNVGMVKMLIKNGAYVNIRSRSRGTALQIALSGGHKEITKELLKLGALLPLSDFCDDCLYHLGNLFEAFQEIIEEQKK